MTNNCFVYIKGEQERKIIQYTNKLQEEIPPNVPFPCNLTGN